MSAVFRVKACVFTAYGAGACVLLGLVPWVPAQGQGLALAVRLAISGSAALGALAVALLHPRLPLLLVAKTVLPARGRGRRGADYWVFVTGLPLATALVDLALFILAQASPWSHPLPIERDLLAGSLSLAALAWWLTGVLYPGYYSSLRLSVEELTAAVGAIALAFTWITVPAGEALFPTTLILNWLIFVFRPLPSSRFNCAAMVARLARTGAR